MKEMPKKREDGCTIGCYNEARAEMLEWMRGGVERTRRGTLGR